MKKNMKFLTSCLLIMFLFPQLVSADSGPKPSVNITFENMSDELCYGTLLSEDESTGPASVWNGNENDIWDNGLDREIWQAFVDYEDADGYYFLQWGWQVNETKELVWGYYPPSPFKILLYYPESDTFIVSGIYERYAFDSYFTVDMSGVTDEITATKSYDYSVEIVSLLCRIVLTILLELGVAWLFGFRSKKQIGVILGINLVTQVVLNVLLNLINYKNGAFAFIFYYIEFEFIVFAIEAVVYAILLKRISEEKISTGEAVCYAFVANIVSFVAGGVIATVVPGMF